MEAEARYVGVEEAARILNTSRGTLDNQRSLRKGPPYSRMGRRIVYDVRDLHEYVQARKVRPEEE